MLYGYDLTLEQMSQIRNYKKKNKFDSKLCSIKDIELLTFEAYVNILFKQTVPLNLFEKYSLKIIQKADEKYLTMNIKKIADLLNLDENIIRENLKNLAQIDMINGLDSDNLIINFDENAEYLQYENKFKKEKIQERFYLTKDEFKDIHNFLKSNKTNNLAIFVEPKVASGFPDIVFASYSPKILENWSEQRENLETNDLKVLSQLLMTKGSTGSELITRLKMPEKDTIQAIEKLLDAHMIIRDHGLWKPVDIKKIYNIKKLISVEAKMTDIKKVAEQSLINTWFASQSYALTSTSNPQSSTIKKFERQDRKSVV